jgi:hypothetical protein
METIARENEFAKISLENGMLVSHTKSKFLKFGYYWYFFAKIFSSAPVETSIPLREIKKMRIQPMSIASITFFLLAAMSLGFGFIRFDDPETGIKSASNVTTGVIVCLAFLACAFLFLRSKTGRLKVMHTYYKGTPLVIYASLDVSELKSLRQLIEKEQTA